ELRRRVGLALRRQHRTLREDLPHRSQAAQPRGSAGGDLGREPVEQLALADHPVGEPTQSFTGSDPVKITESDPAKESVKIAHPLSVGGQLTFWTGTS